MHNIFFPSSEVVLMMKCWVCSIKFGMDYLGQNYKRINDPFESIGSHQSGSVCTNTQLWDRQRPLQGFRQKWLLCIPSVIFPVLQPLLHTFTYYHYLTFFDSDKILFTQPLSIRSLRTSIQCAFCNFLLIKLQLLRVIWGGLCSYI